MKRCTHAPTSSAVHVRQVVAHEQRRTADGHVLLSDDADPVDRVREQPQAEAHQEFRHDAQHVDAGHERQHAEDEDDPIGRHAEHVARQPERARRDHDRDHVQEVVGRHQPALFRVAAALLQQRVQRHREQAAEEADQRQVDRRQRERMAASATAGSRTRPCRSTPIGASPSSTLSPESRPAARLPDADADRGERRQDADPAIGQAHRRPCRRGSSRAAAARRGTRSTRCRSRSATARGRGAALRGRPDFSPRIQRDARARRAGGTRGNAEAERGADDGDARRRARPIDPETAAPHVEQVAADRGAERRWRRTCSSRACRSRATDRDRAASRAGSRTSRD